MEAAGSMAVECVFTLGCKVCVESKENNEEAGTSNDDYTGFEEDF